MNVKFVEDLQAMCNTYVDKNRQTSVLYWSKCTKVFVKSILKNNHGEMIVIATSNKNCAQFTYNIKAVII